MRSRQEVVMSEKITPEKTVSLALIEHTSRPLAYLIIAILAFFFVREPIFDLLRDAQKVKVGSFEVELRARVNQANVGDEFRALQSLDDEQLQLFLIVGKERSDKVPVIYEGEEAIEENFSKLRELGLLEY